MILQQTKIKATIADYEKTPEGGKHQLIESELIEMSAPTPEHQEIIGNLFFQLKTYLLANPIGKIYLSPTDVQLNEENIFQPDILFISNANLDIVKQKRIYGASDLVVEVLSDGTAYYDFKKKKRIYEQEGVKEYWIVDPGTKTIEIYENTSQKEFTLVLIFQEGRGFMSKLFPDFTPGLIDIFN